jgi:hypothetical protein
VGLAAKDLREALTVELAGIGARFFEPLGAPISAKARGAYRLRSLQLTLPRKSFYSPAPSAFVRNGSIPVALPLSFSPP